jgi:hypothetical protein
MFAVAVITRVHPAPLKVELAWSRDLLGARSPPSQRCLNSSLTPCRYNYRHHPATWSCRPSHSTHLTSPQSIPWQHSHVVRGEYGGTLAHAHGRDRAPARRGRLATPTRHRQLQETTRHGAPRRLLRQRERIPDGATKNASRGCPRLVCALLHAVPNQLHPHRHRQEPPSTRAVSHRRAGHQGGVSERAIPNTKKDQLQ